MHETMSGGMLWGMGLLMALVFLAIAALIKYLFFR